MSDDRVEHPDQTPSRNLDDDLEVEQSEGLSAKHLSHADLMSRHVDTRLAQSGRSDERVVSSPVFHASTVLFQSYDEFKEREAAPRDRRHMYYGRMGTPTTRALEDAISALDGAVGAVLSPSGVGSITDILSCFLDPGDHLLMVDSCYGPTRRFCAGPLKRRGIETTFFAPTAGEAEFSALIRGNTQLIFMESPGSGSFEVQDVPMLVKVAKAKGVLTAIDNTWATPLLFNPLDFDVDLAMQSGTKYLNGHADCLYGVTTTRDRVLYERLQRYTLATGSHLAGDDAMLALRGLRTLSVRLAAHDRGARRVAEWLGQHDRVRRVLHPALPECPGHAFFERDFKGATGLFGVIVAMPDESALARFIDALRLFGVGFSWGGFESLCLPVELSRSAASLSLHADERLLRLHIGLEHVDDLIQDLERAFAAS